MLLKEALDNKKFDVRLLDRLLAEGKVTKEEVKAYLETLNDEKDNAHFNETSH